MKLFYYISGYGRNALPVSYFRSYYRKLRAYEKSIDQQVITDRLDYYFKVNNHFPIPEKAVAVKDFKKTKGTGYFLDLKEFLHYFKKDTRFAYKFGDDLDVYAYPTLFKARPLTKDNANSILFKLNKKRHFQWVKDTVPYENKKDKLVWRGGAYWPLRREFVEMYWDHPLTDVGQTNKPAEDVAWQKEPMPIKEQLDYKFIACPEGNDVATNLKWAMSSNSLCIMPRPTCETWFMEGRLEPEKHYVEVKPDFSDLPEKIEYYLAHPDAAKAIIDQAHAFVAQFQDRLLEDLLCLKVLERYAEMSGQKNALKFD